MNAVKEKSLACSQMLAAHQRNPQTKQTHRGDRGRGVKIQQHNSSATPLPTLQPCVMGRGRGATTARCTAHSCSTRCFCLSLHCNVKEKAHPKEAGNLGSWFICQLSTIFSGGKKEVGWFPVPKCCLGRGENSPLSLSLPLKNPSIRAFTHVSAGTHCTHTRYTIIKKRF